MDFEKKLLDSYKRTLNQGGGGNAPIVCPTTYEKPCKLCTLAHEILKDRSLKGTKLSQKALELNQKHKYYSNVIFPAVNPSQVVVFEYGDKIFKKLIGFHMDPTGQAELKIFMDPMKGRNLFIKKTPGATPERTEYDVEPSMSASQLPDINILKDLVRLDDILALMRSGTTKVLSQSKLTDRRTEVRILPSWLGPKSNMFFFPVNYHYGVSEEEFNAITAGELNPFATYKEAPTSSDVSFTPPTSTPRVVTPPPASKEESTGWEGLLLGSPGNDQKEVIKPSVTPDAQDSAYPECFGKYGSKGQECEVECIEDGWAGPCKMMSADKVARDKRAAARRLSK